MKHADEKNPVTIPQRQVEAPFVPEGSDHRGVAGGDIAKLGQHRIAWHHVGDQEDNQRGQQDHDGGDDKAGREVTQHRRTIADRTRAAKLYPYTARL